MEKSENEHSNDGSSLRNVIRQILHEELKEIKSGSFSRSQSRSLYRGGRSRSRSNSRCTDSFYHRRSRSRCHSSRSRSRSGSERRRKRRRLSRQDRIRLAPSADRQRQPSPDNRYLRGAESRVAQTGTDQEAMTTVPNNMEDLLVLEDEDCIQLSEETLNILGADPKKPASSEFKLHGALASRWSHILVQGITKEEVTVLKEKHAVPSNCGLLFPPKINPEVKAILSTAHATRDASHSEYQLHIGTGLSALGKALNVVLEEENNISKVTREKILTNLTDSARIFATLFHEISNTRKYLISPVLNKSVKELTENTIPGEFLFGPDLGERAKSLKSLEKVGQELRVPSTSSRNTSHLGRPSKFSERRGGGGGAGSSRTTGSLNRFRPSYQRREVRHYRGNSSKQLPQNRRQQAKKR